MEIKITLSEAEEKAMRFVAVSPEEWANNVVKERARLAMKEIFEAEVKRMSEDPDILEIPADVDAVVLAADIVLASERKINGIDTPI